MILFVGKTLLLEEVLFQRRPDQTGNTQYLIFCHVYWVMLAYKR